jgi:hypothetical protein
MTKHILLLVLAASAARADGLDFDTMEITAHDATESSGPWVVTASKVVAPFDRVEVRRSKHEGADTARVTLAIRASDRWWNAAAIDEVADGVGMCKHVRLRVVTTDLTTVQVAAEPAAMIDAGIAMMTSNACPDCEGAACKRFERKQAADDHAFFSERMTKDAVTRHDVTICKLAPSGPRCASFMTPEDCAVRVDNSEVVLACNGSGGSGGSVSEQRFKLAL